MPLSRRDFLKISGKAAVVGAVGACAPGVAAAAIKNSAKVAPAAKANDQHNAFGKEFTRSALETLGPPRSVVGDAIKVESHLQPCSEDRFFIEEITDSAGYPGVWLKHGRYSLKNLMRHPDRPVGSRPAVVDYQASPRPDKSMWHHIWTIAFVRGA